MVADVRRTYHEMVTQRYPCMQPIDDPTAAAAATSDTDSDDDLPSSQPSSQSDGKSRSAKVVNRVHNIAFRTLSSIYFAWLKQRHEKEHPPQRIAATPRFSQFSQSGRGRGRGGWGRAAGAAPVTAALDRKPDQSRELRSSDVADLLPALRAELDLRFPGNENRTARTKAYAGVLRTMNQYVQSAEVEWSSITASYFFAKDDPQTNYVKWAKELFAILKTSDRASSIVGKLLQLQSPCATTAISASSSSSTGAAAAAATAATTVRLKAAANGSAAAASIPINAAGTGRDLAVQFSDFIAKSDHYDVLIVDEAQDLNGCDWDLVLRQQVPKLIIGDPHQAIYGFRGAVGIPEPPVFVPTKTLYLRETFRFGAEIATIANSILQLSGERQRLLGSSLPEKVRLRIAHATFWSLAVSAAVLIARFHL